MTDIWNEVNSPVWWFSVVIVGMLVSVLSEYLKIYIDATRLGLSSRLSRMSEQRKEKRAQYVNNITESREALHFAGLRELRMIASATYFSSFGIFGLLFSIAFGLLDIEPQSDDQERLMYALRVMMMGLGSLALGISVQLFVGSIDLRNSIVEARTRRSAAAKKRREAAVLPIK